MSIWAVLWLCIPHFSYGQSSSELVQRARSGDAEAVERLLQAGADPNAREGAFTPLTYAAAQGDTTIVALLLEHGAEPDELGAALFNGHPDVFYMLLEAGADPNASPEYDELPLIDAVWHGEEKALALLLEAGADPNAEHSSGGSALKLAFDRGEHEIFRMLLDAGADPNDEASFGDLPLRQAIKQGDKEFARMLLAAGADPNLVTWEPDTVTPMRLALRLEDPELVRMLFEAGGEPKIQIDTGLVVVSPHNTIDSSSETYLYKRVKIGSTSLEHRLPLEEEPDSSSPEAEEAIDYETVDFWLWWVHRLSADEVQGIEVAEDRIVVPKADHAWASEVEQYDILWLSEPTGDLPPFDRRIVEISEEDEHYVFRTYEARLDLIVRSLSP